MKLAKCMILSTSLLALCTPAVADAQASSSAARQSIHDRLFQLFKESDEATLRRNPLQALFRGDYRYADRMGDLVGDGHFEGENAAEERDRAALHAVTHGELGATGQVAYAW